MTGGSDFLDRFEEFIGASGWRTVVSPAQLLERWRGFVEACEEGYSSTIYEYENERAVRDLLEKALNDPILRKFPEIEGLRSSIEVTDERFRRACRDEVTVGDPNWPWWKRCVPRRAEGEFAADIRAQWEVDAP